MHGYQGEKVGAGGIGRLGLTYIHFDTMCEINN